MSGLRVVFLGTSSGKPTLSRSLSAVAIVRDGVITLLDCGEGTQTQFIRAGLRPSRLSLICLTHFHGDHINGLPGILSTLALDQHDQPLTVVGPKGLREYFRMLKRLRIFAPRFRLNVEELSSENCTLRVDGMTINAHQLDHRIETWGYRLVEDDKPGRFDLEAARALGVPEGPLYGRLQRGESLNLPDGRVIEPQQVLGERRLGRIIAYVTDTRPCEGGLRLAHRADLLIHEATYASDLAQQAEERGHSTASEAALIARQAQTRRLVLTHFSPKYFDLRPLLDSAREIFPDTELAKDLMEIKLSEPL